MHFKGQPVLEIASTRTGVIHFASHITCVGKDGYKLPNTEIGEFGLLACGFQGFQAF